MGNKKDWALSDQDADPVLTLTDIGWDETALDDAEIATVPLNEDVQTVRALLADAEAQCERASDRVLPIVEKLFERRSSGSFALGDLGQKKEK